MNTASSYLITAIPPLLELTVLVVGAVLVGTRGAGTRRRLGMIGLLVLGVVVLGRGTAALTAPMLFQNYGGIYPVIYGAVNVVLSLIWVSGLGLVIAALIARDRSTPPQPYAPQPYRPQPPYPPQPYRPQPPAPGPGDGGRS